jgi:isomerase DpgB
MLTRGSPAGLDDGLSLHIDGTAPLSPGTVTAVTAACDKADHYGGHAILAVFVSGAPGDGWMRDANVALVTKWERALRRLERLAMTTVALASGDVGGAALDALLATDYRIATTGARLLVPVGDGATWPGMAIYRLTQQAGGTGIRRAVLFGTPISANEAADLHLVDECVDDRDAGSALLAAAEMAATFSSRELAIRRQLMFDASTTNFEEALGSHLAACDRTLRRASAGAPA